MAETPEIFDTPDPYSVALPEKFTHVMAVSVLCLIFGTLVLMTLPFEIEPSWAEFLGRGGVYGDHSPIATWGTVATTIATGLGLAALVGGAGAMRFRVWARPLLIGFGVLEVLKGLAGIYFHLKIIQLVNSGYPIPAFGYRITALAEWPDWILGALLGAYTLYTLFIPGVKAAFQRGRAVG